MIIRHVVAGIAALFLCTSYTLGLYDRAPKDAAHQPGFSILRAGGPGLGRAR
jgi:hypothetical protein